jgi:thioredoxin reductase (NADPH)
VEGLDLEFILRTGALLTGLFIILGFWQRSIDRRHRKKLMAEIRDADSRGTRKAIAQFPQIDPYLCIGCSSCIRACPENEVIGLVDGVAHVIHGSRCIGHARCEDACPVGAIKVGLGDISLRPDIPILSETMETSTPGLFIAGELSGMALLRIAIGHGEKVVAHIAEKMKSEDVKPTSEVLDLLIVGSGPAGIAASLKAKECEMNTLTVSQDDIGGTVRHYPRRKLTLTQPATLPLYGKMKKYEYLKEELIEMWEDAYKRFKFDFKPGVKLISLQKNDGDIFETETSAGVFKSRFVVLALGRRGTPRKLGVPGEDNEKVLYRLIDAASYQGQHLLVVGGGDSAIEAATGLADQPGNMVTLSYRKANFFRLKTRNEDRIREYGENGKVQVIFSSSAVNVEPDSVIISLTNDEQSLDGEYEEDGKRLLKLKNDYVLVFAGGIPPFPLLKKMGIAFGGDAPEKGSDVAAIPTKDNELVSQDNKS